MTPPSNQEDSMEPYEPTEAEIDDALALIRSGRGGKIEGIARALKERDAKVRAEERAKRPNRERIARALEPESWAALDKYGWGDIGPVLKSIIERSLSYADAVVALEPEARA